MTTTTMTSATDGRTDMTGNPLRVTACCGMSPRLVEVNEVGYLPRLARCCRKCGREVKGR